MLVDAFKLLFFVLDQVLSFVEFTLQGRLLKSLLLKLSLQAINLHLLFKLLFLATLKDYISVLFLLQLTHTSLNLWEYALLANGGLKTTGILIQFLFIKLSIGESVTQGDILG